MSRTVDYYLSKGFDNRMAEYFANGRRTIISVIPNDDYTLTISFDNGEQRIYNVAPLLKVGTIFEPFADLENFRRVYVDKEHCIAWDIDPNVDSNVVWNNKVDLCPDTCYVDSQPLQGGVINAGVLRGYYRQLDRTKKNKGMTQTELAQATQLTQSVIARLESKKTMPTLNTLLKVAAALDCDLEVVSIS